MGEAEFYRELAACEWALCRWEGDGQLESLAQSGRLNRLIDAAERPEWRHSCVEAAAQLPDAGARGELLRALAGRALQAGQKELAALALRRAAQGGDVPGRALYAWFLRREGGTYAPREMLKLLHSGLQVRDAFSLQVAALILALDLGTEADWRLAERLIAALPKDVERSAAWWAARAREGEAEGALLHLWMLRCGALAESELGARGALWHQVRAAFPQAPADLGE